MRGPRSSALLVSLLLAGGIGVAGHQQPPRAPAASAPCRTAAAAASIAGLPRRRRAGLAERHGHRRVEVRHRPQAGRLRGLRGRRQAERSRSSRASSSRSRWRCCSTPAPAWTSGCRPRRKRRSASRKRLQPGRRDGGDRLRQPGPHPRSRSPTTRPRSKRRSAQTTANGSTSLYNAIYISLKELKKVKAASSRRDPPSGDRRAVGRRGHVEPGRVRRSAGSREAIRDGDLRDRPAPGRDRPSRVQGSGVRAAAALAGNRRPGVLPDRRAPSCRRSTSRSRTSSRASTRSATPRRTRSATAPGAASSSA